MLIGRSAPRSSGISLDEIIDEAEAAGLALPSP